MIIRIPSEWILCHGMFTVNCILNNFTTCKPNVTINLQVGNLTSTTQTHCRCTHLTAFGSMMDVAPNPIDYGAVLAGFSSMFETGNVTVFLFILSMFLIYALVLTWARRADKRDMEQVITSNKAVAFARLASLLKI